MTPDLFVLPLLQFQYLGHYKISAEVSTTIFANAELTVSFGEIYMYFHLFILAFKQKQKICRIRTWEQYKIIYITSYDIIPFRAQMKKQSNRSHTHSKLLISKDLPNITTELSFLKAIYQLLQSAILDNALSNNYERQH